MNYLNNDDLERYWFKYKSEGEPHGTSLERFCQLHKISYKALDNWRRQTRCRIYPVEVYGKEEASDGEGPSACPSETEARQDQTKYVSCRHRHDTSQPDGESRTPSDGETNLKPVRIMVNIRATNGLSVFQKNLDYEGLRTLVERLEGLC